MTTMSVRDKLEKLLCYEDNAVKLRAPISEEYGNGALVFELVHFGNYKVAVYGAGKCGAAIYIWLKEKGIESEFFIDKVRTGNLFGVPVLDTKTASINFEKEKYLVVVAIDTSYYENNLIKKILLSIGAKKVLRRDEIEVNINLWTKDILTHKQELISVLDSLNDEESKKVYLEYIRVHLTRDFWRYTELDFTEKYFCEELFDVGKITDYVCCGGYTGDSVLRFVRKNKTFDSIIIFEPQEKHLVSLTSNIDILPESMRKKIIIIDKECSNEKTLTSAKISEYVSSTRGGGVFLSVWISKAENYPHCKAQKKLFVKILQYLRLAHIINLTIFPYLFSILQVYMRIISFLRENIVRGHRFRQMKLFFTPCRWSLNIMYNISLLWAKRCFYKNEIFFPF